MHLPRASLESDLIVSPATVSHQVTLESIIAQIKANNRIEWDLVCETLVRANFLSLSSHNSHSTQQIMISFPPEVLEQIISATQDVNPAADRRTLLRLLLVSNQWAKIVK